MSQPNYLYMPIIFHQGDQVAFQAGGCVQTGGHGATWKRYIDPSGSNAGAELPGYYHGNVTIQGAYEADQNGPIWAQPVARWSINFAIHHLIVVPTVAAGTSVPAPAAIYLNLGYEDDNYGDNGYYSHDNGSNNQCGPNTDGGNAFVTIIVTHTTTRPVTPPPRKYKSFDLAASSVDSNNLPLNPAWGWQLESTHSVGGTTGPTAGEFRTLCGIAPYTIPSPFPGPNPPIQVYPPLAPAPNLCTDDVTHVNLAPNYPFGICSSGFQNSGHVNWTDVTYTLSTVKLIDKSGSPLDLYNDHDYNFALTTPGRQVSGQPPSGPSGAAPYINGAVRLEFDSTETLDLFGQIPWWKRLSDAVARNDHPTISSMIGFTRDPKSIGHDAIVIGLMGLDAEHTYDSEIHPVHLFAVREKVPADANDDGWAIFARNWGNEGQCSSRDESIDAQTLTVQLPMPPGLDPTHLTANLLFGDGATKFIGSGTTSPVEVFSAGSTAYVTFHLPPAQQKGFIAGELHLRWSSPPPPTSPVHAPIRVTPNVVAPGHLVTVTGDCGTELNTSGEVISTDFFHDATHDFAGQGAAFFTTDPATGRFSTTALIPFGTRPGPAQLSVRCGGALRGEATFSVAVAGGAAPPSSPSDDVGSEPETRLDQLYAGLNPAQRKIFDATIVPWVFSASPIVVGEVAVTERASAPPRPSGAPGTLDVYDPMQVRNILSRFVAFCLAYRGKVPGQPGMCGRAGDWQRKPASILSYPGAPTGPGNPALVVVLSWPSNRGQRERPLVVAGVAALVMVAAAVGVWRWRRHRFRDT